MRGKMVVVSNEAAVGYHFAQWLEDEARQRSKSQTEVKKTE
jgi:hypothetical protein